MKVDHIHTHKHTHTHTHTYKHTHLSIIYFIISLYNPPVSISIDKFVYVVQSLSSVQFSHSVVSDSAI